MSTQVFSDDFREAIWNAFDRKCFYDGIPLLLRSMHIDHLIPERLLENRPEFDKVLASLGMKEFDLNSSLNLVPACQNCNSGKGGINVAANQMILFLNQVRVKQDRLNKLLGKRKAEKSIDQIMRDIDRAISSGKFDVGLLVGDLAARFNDYGYVIEKVNLPQIAAPVVAEVFKPIIFMGDTASAIRDLSVHAHKILYRLDSLRRGDMEGIRPVFQLEASALRVGDVKVLFREYAGKIYVLSVKRKSKHGKG